MSLTTYLGPIAAGRAVGQHGDGRLPLPIRQMELSSPVVSDAVIEEIRRHEVLGLQAAVDATFPLRRRRGGAARQPASAAKRSGKAVHDGYKRHLPHRQGSLQPMALAPIPSLLALGAVHTYLCHQGLRDRCSLIVQAGDVQEGHDICCLVAFGADARPSLPDAAPDQERPDLQGCRHQAGSGRSTAASAWKTSFAALEDSFKKIISKMGITTIEGYRGAHLFEAVGFGPSLMEFLGDFPSRIGGIGLAGTGRGRAVARRSRPRR